jgi:hypothetical protein
MPDILSVALINKACFEPAMDLLWHTIAGLGPIVSVLQLGFHETGIQHVSREHFYALETLRRRLGPVFIKISYRFPRTLQCVPLPS